MGWAGCTDDVLFGVVSESAQRGEEKEATTMSDLYCVQCYEKSGDKRKPAIVVFQGLSLCETHLQAQVKTRIALMTRDDADE